MTLNPFQHRQVSASVELAVAHLGTVLYNKLSNHAFSFENILNYTLAGRSTC
ncbi:hypothetical protein Dtox_1035 [Desulfofarcimen acetoxidans DSM 771]|uniref:Uncharacterized protein n=1 Tax=Desulfofarcimen acetoxidans (strain ATCC 49208 / DSM 771 / KCTC 5769 / VKM B-1644 / 5575) TaxID=485916 RepID=C8W453_DESAS|nr:hypothetical protein Dtox_1035 [Desulfofarcimen acetoxidans DSM 771]